MFDYHASVFTAMKKVTAACLAAAMMMCVAVSCSREKKSDEKKIIAILSEKDEQSLEIFLTRFVKGYPVPSDGKWEYDCSAPLKSGSNLLACIVTPSACADWTLFSDVPEEECFIEKSDDPRDWAKETYCYYTYDAETVEFIAREIFNLSEGSIQLLTERGESHHLFYKENDRYYTVSEGLNDSYTNVTMRSVSFDGDRYYAEFDVGILQRTDNSDELLSVSGRCRAELALKKLTKGEYWSLYRFKSVKS